MTENDEKIKEELKRLNSEIEEMNNKTKKTTEELLDKKRKMEYELSENVKKRLLFAKLDKNYDVQYEIIRQLKEKLDKETVILNEIKESLRKNCDLKGAQYCKYFDHSIRVGGYSAICCQCGEDFYD